MDKPLYKDPFFIASRTDVSTRATRPRNLHDWDPAHISDGFMKEFRGLIKCLMENINWRDVGDATEELLREEQMFGRMFRDEVN